MDKPTCADPECDRDVQAKGMCTTHWSRWYRANRKRPRDCGWCGETFLTTVKAQVMCSLTCASAKAANIRPPAKPKPLPTLKSPEELRAMWDSKRSDLRAAYEESRWDDFIVAMYERCKETPGGCWEWQGQTRTPTKSASPYPVQRWAGKYFSMHRLACEAKYQKPLGTQQAHHTCANTLCVNPDHIQAATHVENIAEMKARKSYEARIAELEQALHGVDPHHPILDRIQYGQTG